MRYFQHEMKSAEKLKRSEFDQQVEHLLRNLLGRVPFLKVKSFHRAAEVFGSQPDWFVEIELRDRPWVLAVEDKLDGQPRVVRNGLLQLQRFIAQTNGAPCYGVMVAP